jgi:trigger factor
MDISSEKIDRTSVAITVNVAKADYAAAVEEKLHELRKTASMKGFRKGKTPLSLIRQLYEESITVDKLEKVIFKALAEWMDEQKLDTICPPLLNEDEVKPLDLTKETHTFKYDVGLSPKLELSLSKKDKIPYFSVKITEEMIDERIVAFRKTCGKYLAAETVEERDIVKGRLVELNKDGTPKTDGIVKEEAALMPAYLAEKERKKFIDAQLNTEVVFNPHKAYGGKAVELSSFMDVKKEEAQHCKSDFSFQITQIIRHVQAEVNQELFDRLFVPGTVTTIGVFREKVRDVLVQELSMESDRQFLHDGCKYILKKTGKLEFPEALLKRHLITTHDPSAKETIEKGFPEYLEELKLTLVREKLLKEHHREVTYNDVRAAARAALRLKYVEFADAPEEQFENAVEEVLKKENTAARLFGELVKLRVITLLKENLTMNIKEVSEKEFRKLQDVY